MNKLEVFSGLGLKVDPFHKAAFDTGDSLRVRRILTMAVESRAMVSIVGPRGMGKSRAVSAALNKIGSRIVMVNKSDKERVTISDIEQAIILDLSDDAPKRGGEIRARQLRPIIGAASRKQQIVLVIEEAQRLHAATLRSLKTLREISWMGESELFTVVLVGQSDPMNRAGVSEVRLRTDCVHVQGLTETEAAGYVRATLGKFFDDGAVEALAALPQANNYLELQKLLVELLSYALMSGREQVIEQDVRDVARSESTALPRSAKAKTVAAPVSGSDALKGVLARRTGAEPTPLRSVV